jgi:hypothetical protein
MTPFIVAEISKTWIDGGSASVLLLAEQFEVAIEHNRLRGYRLHSFQLHQVMVAWNQLTETIIAVFERDGTSPLPAAVDPQV